MINSKNDIDELKSMQREAVELKADQKKPRPRAKTAVRKKPKNEEDHIAEKAPVHGSVGEDLASELDKSVQEIASLLESAGKKIEETVKERPTLSLLTAFTLGIVVGHFLSRR
jgi:ElaB/YqjD/DUF883 family membrane-anchored ribosome-binding protein